MAKMSKKRVDLGSRVAGDNSFKAAGFPSAWSAASRCTQKKVTLRGQSAIVWGQTFTDDGNLDVVTDPASSQAKHEWLTDGRLKKITYKFETSDKKSTREFFYEDTNDSHVYVSGRAKFLRKTLDKKQAGTTICSFAYELDKAGIRQSVTNKDGKYERFGYDPRYQLKSDTKWSAKVPGTRDYQYLYDYDPNGNRISKFANGVETAYEYGDNSELTDAGGAAWTYDHFGNAVTMGNTNISYDFQGHALTISEISKGADTHEYDGDGRRMRSKLNGAANWTHFVHDELSDSILVEYQAAPNPSAKAIYTYGVGLISSSITGVSPTKRWFHFDGLGSTAALTDLNENITDTYEYSAFGIQENSTGSSVNPFRYVGQWGYYDDGARGSQYGLLLLGVRYYLTDVGRFLTWDSHGEINPYRYAINSPLNFYDPDGHQVQVLALPAGPPGWVVAGAVTVGVLFASWFASECHPITMPPRSRTLPIPTAMPIPRARIDRPRRTKGEQRCWTNLDACNLARRHPNDPFGQFCWDCFKRCLNSPLHVWPFDDDRCNYLNRQIPLTWNMSQ
jgi:RHS repeat-associated protein